MRKLLLAVLLLGGLVMSGCATANSNPTSNGSGTPTAASGLMTPLKITRTGGFAGVRQSLTVAADGSWVYNDARGGQSTQGKFTAQQLAALVPMLTDPNLARQLADRATPTRICNDGFQYELQFGTSDSFSFDDCGDLPASVNAIIQALSDGTPF